MDSNGTPSPFADQTAQSQSASVLSPFCFVFGNVHCFIGCHFVYFFVFFALFFLIPPRWSFACLLFAVCCPSLSLSQSLSRILCVCLSVVRSM